ncbi:MFS transporter [Conexibacter woesei]|uniref:MFS transporter n=1 Tax=Conexibacter woesei TaxID=191495 RepID=UPI00041F6B46|nr:MFS transporter [Conexibacter woesei]
MSAISGQGRRDLRLLAAGVAVSTMGDQFASVALLLRLRPHGTGWVAALLAAQVAPMILLAGFIGMLIDRTETRRVLLYAVVGQALVAIPLALAHAPALIVPLFFTLGVFNAAVRPATNALIPAIAGEAEATRGFARLALAMSFGFVFGPALGGVLTAAFGATTALLIDAGTFLVLAVLCLGLRTRRVPAPVDPNAVVESARTARRAGWAALWDDRVLRAVFAVTAVVTAASVVDNVAAPFRFIDQLGTTATGYGIYLSLWGAGMGVGAQIAPRLPARAARYVPAVGQLVLSLGIAGIGVAPVLAVAYVSSLLGGIGNGMANVAQNALVTTRVPDATRGRAFAAASGVFQGAFAVGSAAGGPIVALLDAGTAMIVCGLVGAGAAAVGLVALRR